jgi:hypothetical protein
MTTELEKIIDQYHEIIDELVKSTDMSVETAYTVALKLQENALRSEYNQMYASANVIFTGELVPSALEKIAMELTRLNNNN